MALSFVCPDCGMVLCYEFSLFELKGEKEWEPVCNCGRHTALLALGYDNIIYLALDFPCCAEPHEYYFHPEEFVEEPVMALTCDRDDGVLAYIGQAEAIHRTLRITP